MKRIRVREQWNLDLRAAAISATNGSQFAGPNVDINSLTFGRITFAGGNRIVVVGLRFNF